MHGYVQHLWFLSMRWRNRYPELFLVHICTTSSIRALDSLAPMLFHFVNVPPAKSQEMRNQTLTRLTCHLDLDMFYRNWLSLLNYAMYAIYASISVVVPVEFHFMQCRADGFGFSLGFSCVADWIWRWGTGATCNFQLCLLNFTFQQIF